MFVTRPTINALGPCAQYAEKTYANTETNAIQVVLQIQIDRQIFWSPSQAASG